MSLTVNRLVSTGKTSLLPAHLSARCGRGCRRYAEERNADLKESRWWITSRCGAGGGPKPAHQYESANRFLDGKYLCAFHRQFGRTGAVPWRRIAANLDEGLNWEKERVVQGDWTVACGGRR